MIVDMSNLKMIIKWLYVSSLIGVVGSLSAIFISIIVHFAYLEGHFNPIYIPFALAFSGLLVDFCYNLKGSGVDRVLKALKNNIPLNPIVGFLKIIAAGIVIGFGGSAGKEGPCVQSSASFADVLYEVLKLKYRKAVIISGIAGGLSGAFCAPLGSAIFASEIVNGHDFSYRSLFPSIFASIIGYFTYYSITGKKHLFNIDLSYSLTPFDFIMFFICAVFCSMTAFLYISTYGKIRDYFDSFKCPQCLKSFIGGLVVALIGYFVPQVLGLGIDVISNLFFVKYGVVLLILMLLGKILATTFTVGVGTPGGLVIPSMFVGAVSGALFGTLIGVENIAPFVILGIAASMASIANVPLASAILCTEIFGFDFAVPAAIGALLGYQLTRWNIIYKYISL
ncbi:chloride channel protein [Methanotorris igneus]|uniref:Cl-channel voltage-gated family protein n=1 Tax=Methanotorris igneus (strain DSM 5666 / JCM 11834 / Kol 5) TaxID=880724 RepID=F6BAE1_METIK|nr:chloride channel protein [Methanotorris igneus]AEF95831.1 Cl- channel voltage-gated family protein [Methanotorris igneus Kol 5]